MEHLQTIGQKIRDLRLEKGVSQSRFGEIYGIPFRTIQNWEYGKNEPPLYVYDMLRKLSEMEKMYLYAYVLTERTNIRGDAKYTFFKTLGEAREFSVRRWNRLPMAEQGRFITTKGARFDISYAEVEWNGMRFVVKTEEERLWDIIQAQKNI